MCDVTRILGKIEAGDSSAAEQLLPLVYEELRKLAAAKWPRKSRTRRSRRRPWSHEAYLRLVDVEKAQHWDSRGHFFAAAAEAMRRILVEQARRKERVRHGGEFERVDLRDVVDGRVPDAETILAVHDALTCLAEQEPDVAEIVKLHFFAGLTLDETADAAIDSRPTVYRQWAYAQAYLRLMMRGERVRFGRMSKILLFALRPCRGFCRIDLCRERNVEGNCPCLPHPRSAREIFSVAVAKTDPGSAVHILTRPAAATWISDATWRHCSRSTLSPTVCWTRTRSACNSSWC